MSAPTVFDEVLEQCGLSKIFARAMVQRVVAGVGVTRPESLTPADLARALPALEDTLRNFLRPEELRGAMSRLRRLATA